MLMRIAQLTAYLFILAACAVFCGDITATEGGLPGTADVAKFGLVSSVVGLMAFHYHCKHSM